MQFLVCRAWEYHSQDLDGTKAKIIIDIYLHICVEFISLPVYTYMYVVHAGCDALLSVNSLGSIVHPMYACNYL